MERLFVDTSAWLAFVNKRAPSRRAVAKVLKAYRGRLVTTNFVFDETLTLCVQRLSHAVAVSVGGLLREPDAVVMVRVDAEDESEAWDLFGQRPDKRYSFTDCTSFAVMRRLGLDRVATLDADFAREGFEVVPRIMAS